MQLYGTKQVFAAEDIITFRGVDSTNAGQILHDGDYGSINISEMQIDIFNADPPSPEVSTGSFLFFEDLSLGLDGSQSGMCPIYETSGNENTGEPPKLTIIKSNDGSEFSFNSIFVIDYIAAQPEVRFEGFRDGDSMGYVDLNINQTNYMETFASYNGLTSSIFQNVDEVRISNNFEGNLTWGNNIGFNNIEIGNPVVPNAAPTIANNSISLPRTNEDTVSPVVNVSSIVNDSIITDANGDILGIAVTGIEGNGTWQYSTDGSTWTSFGTVPNNIALLLSGTS